ncbi:MAG: YdcF family protein [Mogibacterium sp.]|nr:YdcF family protein [Mogibacterium sp.]
MKFDTLDKKPKLYNLLAVSAVTAVIVILLVNSQTPRHAVYACGVMIVYLAVAIFLLMRAFAGQIRYNPYSYNTIYYSGFSLFALSLMITYVILMFRMIKDPYVYTGNEIQHMLAGSATLYMLVSAPFIFAFSAALCISNISLIRHEGKRLVNILGIILSFLMIGGEVFLFFFNSYSTGSMMEVMVHDIITNLFAAVYLYYECMLIGAMIANAIAALYEPDLDKDYLIILGCGLRSDGSPTPLLRGRIDKALDFRRRQLQETGKDLVFVTSGGQGPDEVMSESRSMKYYLLEQGIPADQIIEEDQSSDTHENMQFSKAKIEEHGTGKVAFSTTNYHVFRSGLCARRVKMRAVGMGAKTKWYFWPNASVREFVGLLTEHRLKQAIIFGSLITSYLVLTIMSFQ